MNTAHTYLARAGNSMESSREHSSAWIRYGLIQRAGLYLIMGLMALPIPPTGWDRVRAAWDRPMMAERERGIMLARHAEIRILIRMVRMFRTHGYHPAGGVQSHLCAELSRLIKARNR